MEGVGEESEEFSKFSKVHAIPRIVINGEDLSTTKMLTNKSIIQQGTVKPLSINNWIN